MPWYAWPLWPLALAGAAILVRLDEAAAQSLEEAALEQPSPRGWLSKYPETTSEVVLGPEAYERPIPEREAPQVVSLEQLSFDSEKRHDKFHKRLETLKPAAKVRRPAPSLYRVTNDEDVRRAIVMSEILGPPKALQRPEDLVLP